MNILFMNIDEKTYKLSLVVDESTIESEHLADRNLAKNILKYIDELLKSGSKDFGDIDAIAIKRGPGSFTSLRIIMTVANTLAGSLDIPIVGEIGENWKNESTKRIKNGQNDKIVTPIYDKH